MSAAAASAYAVRVDCVAVIPCYNEAAAIGQLVTAVRVHLARVIVVDDGSTDGTVAAGRTAGAEILSSPANQGKGAALQLGLHRARELGFVWALLLDGDGQHAPEDIPGFLAALETDHADLVVGDRMVAPEEMPFVRRAINRIMSAVISSLAGTRLPDTQCGFRLVRLSAWETLPLRCTRFEVESEILLAFLAAGRRVEFIPVRIRYKAEHSKIRPFRDTLRWLRWLWRSRGDFARSRARFKSPSPPPA